MLRKKKTAKFICYLLALVMMLSCFCVTSYAFENGQGDSQTAEPSSTDELEPSDGSEPTDAIEPDESDVEEPSDEQEMNLLTDGPSDPPSPQPPTPAPEPIIEITHNPIIKGRVGATQYVTVKFKAVAGASKYQITGTGIAQSTVTFSQTDGIVTGKFQ
ncbi:MAG: hypothetical protein Q4D33_10190, partial [Prevotellaceae bacterium]|nr:hypothetical protein [Prevotellaceae bacterium]